MTTSSLLVSCFIATVLCLPTLAADEGSHPSLSVGGLLFGDLYYDPGHHLESGDRAAGAVVRRAYLTFNATLGEKTFGRLRFETNQSGEFETYTYKTQVKDLYLGWNLGRQRLVAGLTSTTTYDLIEQIWGFRYLARTPMDLQGVPSRDTGLSLSGPLGGSGSFSYRAMVGAGLEFQADSSDSAKWMGAVTWKPAPGWTVDLYADYEDLRGAGQRSTVQAFLAWQGQDVRWGMQYSNQNRRGDPPIDLASVFLVKNLGQSTSLVGRVDRLFKPSPKGNNIAYLPMDPSASATTFLGGVAFQLLPHVSLTPNTVVTAYDRSDQGDQPRTDPRTDIYLRLTLFIDYE
jgi:hypothetical protein